MWQVVNLFELKVDFSGGIVFIMFVSLSISERNGSSTRRILFFGHDLAPPHTTCVQDRS